MLKRFIKKYRPHLKKLEEADKIPYINNGGCAIVALAHYRWAKTVLDQDLQILWGLGEYDLFANADSLVQDGGTYPCRHAVLKFEAMYLDSGGLYSEDYIKESVGIAELLPVDEEYTLECINSKGWNSSFNREEGVQRLREIYGDDALEGVEVW
jgi:hypothetical protein